MVSLPWPLAPGLGAGIFELGGRRRSLLHLGGLGLDIHHLGGFGRGFRHVAGPARLANVARTAAAGFIALAGLLLIQLAP
jgi:hypothetical protein